MSPLNIGFVSAGTIARHHADALEELDESITAVADVNLMVLTAFSGMYGAPKTYEDYDRMFAEANLDAAVVGVPNTLHADCAVVALDADIDVLVENSLAESSKTARRVEAAERESDARVMIRFKKAFDLWFEYARRKVRSDEFDEVYDVESEYARQPGILQLGSWFMRKAVSASDAIIDIGVHQLQLALSLLDFPEVRTVSATTGSHFGTKEDYTYLSMWGGDPMKEATFDVDDFTRVFVQTGDGTTIATRDAFPTAVGR